MAGREPSHIWCQKCERGGVTAKEAPGEQRAPHTRPSTTPSFPSPRPRTTDSHNNRLLSTCYCRRRSELWGCRVTRTDVSALLSRARHQIRQRRHPGPTHLGSHVAHYQALFYFFTMHLAPYPVYSQSPL